MRQPDALRGRQRRPVGLDAWLHSEEARGQLMVAVLSDDVIKINLASCTSGSGRRDTAWRSLLSCSSAHVSRLFHSPHGQWYNYHTNVVSRILPQSAEG